MDKMDYMDVVDEMSGEKQRLKFIRDKIKRIRRNIADNDIVKSIRAEIENKDNLSLSYFRDGTIIVSRVRYHPVYTHISVRLDRPSRAGKRKAIAYVLKAMSEVIQDEDVNEDMDI